MSVDPGVLRVAHPLESLLVVRDGLKGPKRFRDPEIEVRGLPGELLQRSRQAVQEAYASQILSEQSLEAPLAQLLKGPPVSCSPETPLRDALAQMQQRRIGSMLVVDSKGRPAGIFTRYDILGRVTLDQVPLDTPIGQVMVQPVHSLSVHDTA